MNLLKKINKGFILTVIVLLILIIYLICVESKRNYEKPVIERACLEYIDTVSKYAIMPSDAQKVYKIDEVSEEDKNKIEQDTKSKIASQMNKLKEELSKKMIDNELAVNMQKDAVEDSLESNNNIFESVVISNNHEVKKIKKFRFDDNQVTVTFSSIVEQEKKYLNDER